MHPAAKMCTQGAGCTLNFKHCLPPKLTAGQEHGANCLSGTSFRKAHSDLENNLPKIASVIPDILGILNLMLYNC